MKTYVARISIRIAAPAAKVWEALTRPELIKQYLFGTEVKTDWQPGKPIRFTGVWQGKPYEDKGVVIDFVQGHRLVHTFWSSLSGIPDLPENYKTITYVLAEVDGETLLTLMQDNNATEEAQRHSESNWLQVMQGLKKLVE